MAEQPDSTSPTAPPAATDQPADGHDGETIEFTFPIVTMGGPPSGAGLAQALVRPLLANAMARALADTLNEVVEAERGGAATEPGAGEDARGGERGTPERPQSAPTPTFLDMLRYLTAMNAGPIAPPPWANAEWQRLLNMSMADSGGVKKVASEEGLDAVKKRRYEKPAETDAPEQVCAITQVPFEEGDEVAEMPCGHVFDAESLMRWLQRESAACPVCRVEVASREVMRSPEGRASSAESGGADERGEGAAAAGGPAGLDDTLLQPLLPQGRIRVRMGNPVFGTGMPLRQRRLGDAALARAAAIEQESEDDQIEAAILAAVMRDSLEQQ